MGSDRLTPDELATWRSFFDVTTELRSFFATQLQRETTLSPGDYSILVALSESDMLRSSDLAACIDWERSRLSHHLARMEKRQLIQRTECKTDSRGAEIRITEEGAHAFRQASAPHLKAIKTHFVDALTAEQLSQLADITTTLHQHLHPELAAVSKGSN